jgi:hypothetical protein
MTDCLAATGAAPFVPLIASIAALLVGVAVVVVVLGMRRRGARAGAALALAVALVGGLALASAGPAPSAQAADCAETVPAEPAPEPAPAPDPAPAPAPEPTPPVVVPALAAVWASPTVTIHPATPGGFPSGTTSLSLVNTDAVAVSAVSVTITETPLGSPTDSVLMGQTVSGDGWSFVSGGGGTLVIAWNGTLEPSASTPPVQLRFSSDVAGVPGSVLFRATPAALGVQVVAGDLRMDYDTTVATS